MSDINTKLTYEEIRACDETVKVNKKALLRAYNDGVFNNYGYVHERYAKSELRKVARSIDTGRIDE